MTNAPRALLLRLGIAILSVSSGLLFYCSIAPIAAGGSGTGVGNGMVVGKVMYPDGSAARNAVVRLRTIAFLPDTSGVPAWGRNDTTANVTTDESGIFRIDTVDTGKSYYIEVIDKEAIERGTLYRVTVASPDTTRLETRIVTPVKTLAGRIIVSNMPKNAYVLIYGLERVDKTDSLGRFEITELPIGDCERGECEYKVRIIILDGASAVSTIDYELEIEFDAQGNIIEVELELDDEEGDND